VPPAVIAFAFDPMFRSGAFAVRLETVAIALAILVGLLLAGWLATRTETASDLSGPRPAAEPGVPDTDRLRLDDMIFIVLAILPGALIGGRLGYALIHLDFYRANPQALLDPAQGALELALAVIGGTLTGAYAAFLLGESVGRWLHVATVPTLATLTLGKIALAFGGEGQGLPSDAWWATSYHGDGPWGSLAAAVPSHPAQLYEAGATFLVLVLMTRLLGAETFSRGDGRAFPFALMLWLLARAAVATTWRDQPLLGQLNAEQVMCVPLAVGCFVVLVVAGLMGRRQASRAAEPSWPDPETRAQY
jgi:prolipoprotein diacylglyceryltransferase